MLHNKHARTQVPNPVTTRLRRKHSQGSALQAAPLDVEMGETSPEPIRWAPMTAGMPFSHRERGMRFIRYRRAAAGCALPAGSAAGAWLGAGVPLDRASRAALSGFPAPFECTGAAVCGWPATARRARRVRVAFTAARGGPARLPAPLVSETGNIAKLGKVGELGLWPGPSCLHVSLQASTVGLIRAAQRAHRRRAQEGATGKSRAPEHKPTTNRSPGDVFDT